MQAGRLIPRDIVKTLYDSDTDGTVYKGWTRQKIQHLHEYDKGNVFMLVLADHEDPGHFWASVYVVGNATEHDHLPWGDGIYLDTLAVLAFADGDGFRLWTNEDLGVSVD